MMYTYLVCSMLALIVWIAIFFLRKDLRRPLLVLSSAMAILGVAAGVLMWTRDWWRPETITGTVIGIEDVLFGFGLGGIAFAYAAIAQKKLVRTVHPQSTRNAMVVLLGIGGHVVLFFGFGLHSFVASIIGFLLPVCAIYYFRRDLVMPSILGGAVAVLWGLCTFNILTFIDPGFISRWYLLGNLSGTVMLNAVPEDLVWFFIGGMLFSVLYPFWTGTQYKNRGQNTSNRYRLAPPANETRLRRMTASIS